MSLRRTLAVLSVVLTLTTTPAVVLAASSSTTTTTTTSRSSSSSTASSLAAFVSALDRKLTAAVVYALAQLKHNQHEHERLFASSSSSSSSSSLGASAPSHAHEFAGRGFGRSLFDSLHAADSGAEPLVVSTRVSSFLLVEPRTPQAFPLLGIIGFPLPLLHQLGLVILTLLLAISGALFVREAIDSTHANFFSSAFASTNHFLMAILTGNAASLGSVGLSSDFSSRVANAVSSGLGHAFPSSAGGTNTSNGGGTVSAQRSFGTGAGQGGSIMLAPKAKHGDRLRRSKVTAPTQRGAAGAAPAAAAAATGGVSPEVGHYRGLRNMGNTCFFNSVIQSLASCPTLLQHLDQVTLFAEAWDVPTPVTDALREVLLNLNAASERRQPAMIPSQLTSALSAVSASNGLRSLTAAHQQQDAHELFALLSDALESELREIQRERRAVLFSSGRGLAAAIAPTRARSAEWVVPSPVGGSPDPGAEVAGMAGPLGSGGNEEGQAVGVADEQPGDPRHPFKGWTAQRTGCVDCHYTEGIRHLSSEELTLTVPQLSGMRAGGPGGSRGVALEQLLDEWSKLEVVQWNCHRCSLRATAERVRAEVIRLGGEDPARVAAQRKALAMGPHAEEDGLGHPHQNGTTEKAAMTVSKKKRLREAQRAYDKLVRVLELNIHEDELALAHPPLLPADLKMERIASRCATKQIMLARPPPILVIHLNRSIFGGFGGGASKNNTFVHYGEWLDMEPFATGAELDVRSDQRISSLPAGAGGGAGAKRAYACLYRLQSIVVHYGGHSFGHYVSYRRTPSPPTPSPSSSSSPSAQPAASGTRIRKSRQAQAEWMRISDDIVEPCDLGDVLASNPFLLFYERWVGPLPGSDAGMGAGSDESAEEDGTPAPPGPAPGRAGRVSKLDDIDDFDGSGAGGTQLLQSRADGEATAAAASRAVASLKLVRDSSQQEAHGADEQLERLKMRVRPRVVQRWESPAPRASL
ncbi:ubiquitin-specific protease ubp1 [Tilletia horrida]|nr:ubiquitin-specific protease ubp1 [Tilletia horrida]